VLGGTFDPVHHAHLFAAEVAGAALGLQQVLLVPASQSPLKGRAGASAADRVAMLRLAVAGNLRLAVSTIDVDRPPPSYTVDTLAHLRQNLGGAVGHPRLELYLILGIDALQEFREWREPERTLDLCRLIVVPRPGYELVVPPPLAARLGARVTRILLLPMPRLEISSTDIRRRIGAGEPVRYLLPEAVQRYIGEHGLYGQP
jgi:nicotinate-nucleotide adenylyltransferase